MKTMKDVPAFEGFPKKLPGQELLDKLFQDFSRLMPLYEYMQEVWNAGRQ